MDGLEKPARRPSSEDDHDEEDDEPLVPSAQSDRPSWFRFKVIDKHLSVRLPNLLPAKFLRTLEVVYTVIDKTILILGFIALTTGGVTYAGIFVSAAAQSL